MSLKEILCQDHALDILQRAYRSGRMPHSYIFAGPEGIGKFKTAIQWSKVLLCKNPITENGFVDSCTSCKSCELFDAAAHPDFHHVHKELIHFTKQNIEKKAPVDLRIDVLREFLIEKISLSPTVSDRTVFVISESEKLNPSSQNALLKVLEEPPAFCTIFLLCTRLEKLLPTIKSRCQIIRFAPLAEQFVIENLKQLGLPDDQAGFWARLGNGSLGRSLTWANLELAGAELYNLKNQLLTRLATYQYHQALDFAAWLSDETRRLAGTWADLDKATSKTDIHRRAQKTIIQIIISALHDAMKINLDATEKLVNYDQQELLEKLARRFNLEQGTGKIINCYRTLRQIESSVNEKLIFEQLLLNLASPDIIDTL